MPEGHSVRRHAQEVRRRFGGQVVAASSPQGRFADGAGLLDGSRLVTTDAHGKHLFVGFAEPGVRRIGRSGAPRWLHVHLGLYGAWTFGRYGSAVATTASVEVRDEVCEEVAEAASGAAERGAAVESGWADGGETGAAPPEPRGAVRLRLVGEDGWADLRGPTACEVLDPDAVAAVRDRLGEDPLRADADPAAAWDKIRRSRTPVGALLMRQDVVAGVGNVYRAEALFRAGIDPHRPGREVSAQEWDDLWQDLTTMMRAGVRAGRIVTTEPADRDRRSGRASREDAYYVYRRGGLPCRRCGTPVVAESFVARTLYRCPACQGA